MLLRRGFSWGEIRDALARHAFELDGYEEIYELVHGELGGKARHEGDAHAREHKDNRQYRWVRSGGEGAHRDMRGGKRREESQRHRERGEGEGGARGRYVKRVEERHRERGGDKK